MKLLSRFTTIEIYEETTHRDNLLNINGLLMRLLNLFMNWQQCISGKLRWIIPIECFQEEPYPPSKICIVRNQMTWYTNRNKFEVIGNIARHCQFVCINL